IATAFCQLPIKYLANVQEADSLYILQQYKRSAIKFSAAFQANKGFGLIEHRYNAAKAWTQAGYPDSAFSHLDRIAMAGRSSDLGKYTDIQYISSDSTLKGLQKLP